MSGQTFTEGTITSAGGNEVMKISKKRVMEIVREELEKLNEINPSHIPAGRPGAGRFTKRGAGNVYSLTKNAEGEIGNSKTLKVQRGMETSGDSVRSKFGMNSSSDPKKQCGRKTISGDNKSPTRSCTDYPDLYELLLAEAELMEGESCDQCIQQFLARIRRANAALKAARDGKTK